ncbi:MAG: branched-chain amino acid ABC transporter permease [bacterium]
MFRPWSAPRWFAVGAGIFALILLPSVSENDDIRKWMDILMIVILATSWNFIGGLTGYPSFAPAAFFGLGAYTTAILMNAGMDFFSTLALGGLAGGGVALVLGIPILRLRGHYFAIATFGVAEFFRELADNLEITGGGDGINLPQITGGPDYFTRFFYFAMLGVAVLGFLTQYFVTRHRLGFGLVAIRENEDAAAMVGVDTTKYKILAFVLSGIFPAMGGGVYAYRAAFLEAIDVFDILFSIKAILMSMLGGVGTVMGPLVGAFLMEYLADFLWVQFTEFHSLFLGIIIVLVVLFVPNGLMAVFAEIRIRGIGALGAILRANAQRFRI